MITIVARLTLLLLLITLLSYFGSSSYIFEIFSHFKQQYLFLFLLSIGFFALFYRREQPRKWLLISLIGFSFNALAIFPLYLPSKVTASTQTESQQFSVLLANVLSSNQSKQKFVKLIQKKQADFVIALEIDRLWANALQEISSDYPYKIVIPRNDNFGIALYSKHSLTNIHKLDFAKNNIPSIASVAHIAGKEVQIIATHPFPPFTRSFAQQQKSHFRALSKYIKKSKSATVIVGDLNTAFWSSAYKDLIELSALKNTRQGFGIIPSWSVNSILQLALDHVLVSENIQTLNIQAMQSIDSDHLPIYVELSY